MKKSLARAVLATDENYKIVGMIRRRDIPRELEPREFFGRRVHHPKYYFGIEPDLNFVEAAFDHLFHRCWKQADEPVANYMVLIEHTTHRQLQQLYLENHLLD